MQNGYGTQMGENITKNKDVDFGFQISVGVDGPKG